MDTQPHHPTNGEHYVPTPEEIAIGYELRDTHLKPVVIFCIVLAATVVASLWVVVVVENKLMNLAAKEGANLPQPHILSQEHTPPLPTQIPPGPLLEPSPPNGNLPQQDLAELKEHMDMVLASSNNLGNGFARIPIKSAINMVVEKGVPLKLPATQPSAGPTMPASSAQHAPGGNP